MNSYDILQKKFWHRDKSNRRDVTHPVVVCLYKRQAEKLKNLIPTKVTSILDCGCGNGFFQTFLSEAFQINCMGVDFSSKMLRVNPNAGKVAADIAAMPFENKYFDLVTCSMLFHHLSFDKQSAALKEMRRVARKYIFITEPNGNNLANVIFALFHPEERRLLDFDLRYLRKIFKENNLTILNAYVDSLLLPNATPRFMLPILRKLDKTALASLFGFNCNVLCCVQSKQ